MTDVDTSTPPLKRPLTYDHLKSQKKANREKVRIALDPEVADRYSEAQAKLDMAKLKFQAKPERGDFLREMTEAQAEYEAARAEFEEHSVEFIFKAIGRSKYDKLVLRCPPTEDEKQQVADAGGDPRQLIFNARKFPQLLIGASIVEPPISQAEVDDMFEDDMWNGAELVDMFNAALRANSERKVVDLGNA